MVVVEFASSNVPVSETAGVVMVCIIKTLEVATPLDVDIRAIDLTATGTRQILLAMPH